MATQRYALNKNKYLLDPEIEKLESLLSATINKSPLAAHLVRSTKSSRRKAASLTVAPAQTENLTPSKLAVTEPAAPEFELRDALILTLAMKTGARASELLGLRHVDLNPYDQTVFIRGIKGSNDREIPIAPLIFNQLMAYANTRPKTENLFPIGYHRLRQIWDWYRPAPKKFHSLRHTFAIRLYRKTKDLRLVQVALGHRNITNTMIYADYVYSQHELRKLIL